MVEPKASRGGALHPLAELTRVRMLEFLREPEAVFWVFVFPVLLALALGIAFRESGATSYRVGVTDPAIADRLAGAAGLTVMTMEPAPALEALGRGRLDIVVEAAPGESPLPQFVFRFDPARPEGRSARLAVDDALQRAYGRKDLVEHRDEPTAERGSRYIDFLIPGLIGLNLMGSGMWGIGFSIVVARTRGLLKRFAATPMRRPHYLVSYALSRLLFLVLEVAAIVGFGWLIFGVAVRGPLLALLAVAIGGGLSFAALGLLVAARSRTIESVSGWMNLIMLPMWLLSGSFFSYERFPEAFWPAIRLLPLTAVNDALRAVFRGEALLGGALPELAVLAVWGLVSFAIAVRRFRWH
ncbi:MAG: ABC transporter permease [Holophagae bacterium]|nr:MAG: ABC transporter permease [Holophagae bacterium]